MREKSLASLIQSLRVGAGIGAVGVVLHPGSAKQGDVGKAITRAGKVIKEALDETDRCPLHLEDTAGAGGTLGRSFEELAALLDAVRRRQAPRRSASTRATCSPRATTSAPRRASAEVARRVRPRRRTRASGVAARQRFDGGARIQPRPPRDHGRGRARREGLRGVPVRAPVREAAGRARDRARPRQPRPPRTWRWRRSCAGAASRIGREQAVRQDRSDRELTPRAARSARQALPAATPRIAAARPIRMRQAPGNR